MKNLVFLAAAITILFRGTLCAHQSEHSHQITTSTAELKDPTKISSLNELLDIPFRQFQQGILLNLLNSNLVRFGNYRTMLNLSAGVSLSVKPIVHPESSNDGVSISVFLFASQENSITETQILSIADGLIVEVQNTFGYFKRNFDPSGLKGFFEERLSGDRPGRRWDLENVVKALQIQKTLTNFARQIMAMAQAEELMRIGKIKEDSELRKKHLIVLKQIISMIGWPTIQLVGNEASHMAWSLVHHADFDAEYQKSILEVLKKTSDGQIMKSEIAFLTDRILINDGKKQLFGTQYEVDQQGNIIPKPIDAMDKVDERRQKYGLNSFSEYLATLKQSHQKLNKSR